MGPGKKRGTLYDVQASCACCEAADGKTSQQFGQTGSNSIHRRINTEGTHNRWKCDERRGKLWVEKCNKKRQDRENRVTCYVREIKLHVKPGYHRVNDKEMIREF